MFLVEEEHSWCRRGTRCYFKHPTPTCSNGKVNDPSVSDHSYGRKKLDSQGGKTEKQCSQRAISRSSIADDSNVYDEHRASSNLGTEIITSSRQSPWSTPYIDVVVRQDAWQLWDLCKVNLKQLKELP